LFYHLFNAKNEQNTEGGIKSKKSNLIMDKSKILDFEEPEEQRNSFGDIRKWWEARRKKYNIVVVLTVFAMFLIEYGLTKHNDAYWIQYLGDVIYCIILANIAYTFGWVSEQVYKGLTNKVLSTKMADTLFKLGLVFSITTVVITGIYSIVVYK
jgi:hypothetical protein